MPFHIHQYERIGKPKHLRYDINGTEVLTALCKCQICSKEKEQRFVGHIVGNMFEKQGGLLCISHSQNQRNKELNG